MTVHATPSRTVTAADADALVGVGGYVHPLFTDPAHLAASPFAARPLPGQGLLLMMGGLAEQTDVYDDRTVALLGFERVVFHAPALEGDTLHVEIEALEPDGERVTRWTWRALRADGTLLAEATPRFLVRRPG